MSAALSRRERTIASMLERWHELATPAQGNPGGRSTDRLLAADHDKGCPWAEHGAECTCWVASYGELERCLCVMRKLGRQRALSYEHDGQEKTIPLGTAYQHVLWWYVDVSYRSVPVYATVVERTRRGWEKRRKETGRKLEERRHRDARQEKASAGVRFLAELMRIEPCLPQDVAKGKPFERAA